MTILFLVSAAALFYVYFGYPIILGLLARMAGSQHRQTERLPTVTIVTAAYQEAVVIGEKLANFEDIDYPADKLDCLIVSDECTDGTDEIVADFASPRVRLLRQVPRAGKASALNLALKHVSSEIIVFTDANVMFHANAVRSLVRHFEDDQVGAVTGVVYLVDKKVGYAESDGAYYKYERYLQLSESHYWSVVGVDGALYAARRELVKPPPPQAILDDFVISMEIAKQGKRIVYDAEATALEDAAPGLSDEFRRKTRVAIGAFQSLRHGWGVPGLSLPRLAFCYFSHKVLRWLGPWALLGCFVSCVALAQHDPLWLPLAVAQAAFYLSALAGLCFPVLRPFRIVSIPMYFVLMNTAFAVGAVRSFTGSSGRWKPTARTKLPRDE
jgi:poly-beta-1,6-N-acetyl-D-glucosamine synthase